MLCSVLRGLYDKSPSFAPGFTCAANQRSKDMADAYSPDQVVAIQLQPGAVSEVFWRYFLEAYVERSFKYKNESIVKIDQAGKPKTQTLNRQVQKQLISPIAVPKNKN